MLKFWKLPKQPNSQIHLLYAGQFITFDDNILVITFLLGEPAVPTYGTDGPTALSRVSEPPP